MKIIGTGLNYLSHIEEQGIKPPAEPLLFGKFPTTLIGPGEAIVLPPESVHVDSEAELAVEIGRVGRRIHEDDALEFVAGYRCANDVSARDLQRSDKQWTRAKGFDTFCPLGTELVPVSELGDASGLRVVQRLNGELLQDGNTAELVFGVRRLVAFVSAVFTLEPGDLILTGTPSGRRHLPYAADRDGRRRPRRDRDRGDRGARQPGSRNPELSALLLARAPLFLALLDDRAMLRSCAAARVPPDQLSSASSSPSSSPPRIHSIRSTERAMSLMVNRKAISLREISSSSTQKGCLPVPPGTDGRRDGSAGKPGERARRKAVKRLNGELEVLGLRVLELRVREAAEALHEHHDRWHARA